MMMNRLWLNKVMRRLWMNKWRRFFGRNDDGDGVVVEVCDDDALIGVDSRMVGDAQRDEAVHEPSVEIDDVALVEAGRMSDDVPSAVVAYVEWVAVDEQRVGDGVEQVVVVVVDGDGSSVVEQND